MEYINQTEKICFNYKIISFEMIRPDGRTVYSEQLYNTKAKKHPVVEWYNYKTPEERDKRVSQLITNITAHNQRKQKAKEERINFVNPAKNGDILVASWGYDQTNIDFYQVVNVTGKFIQIKPISETREYDQAMAGHCKPCPGSFIVSSYEKLNTKYKVRKGYNGGYCISINSYKTASLTSPSESHYFSEYA